MSFARAVLIDMFAFRKKKDMVQNFFVTCCLRNVVKKGAHLVSAAIDNRSVSNGRVEEKESAFASSHERHAIVYFVGTVLVNNPAMEVRGGKNLECTLTPTYLEKYSGKKTPGNVIMLS